METFNDNKSIIPKYLEELVKPTPLSVARLVAAWEGLSVETQITILTEYLNTHPKRYLINILYIADKSCNLYVKQLSAKIKTGKNIFETDFDINLSNNFGINSNICQSEIISSRFSDGKLLTPKLLFETDYNTIINFIFNFSSFNFRFSIPEFILYYYSNNSEPNRFTEDDIFDFLSEYFDSIHFKYSFSINPRWQISNYGNYLGWSGDEFRIEVKCIWNLLKYVKNDTSDLILQNLPNLDNESVDVFYEFYNILDDKWIAKRILKNNRLLLYGVRKSIFESNSYDLETRIAAASVNLNVSYNEFSDIISKPQDIKFESVYILNSSADVDLCIFWATVDILNSSTAKKLFETNYNDVSKNFGQVIGAENISFRLKNINDNHKNIIINRLRIYEIAKIITPWNFNGENDLFPSRLEKLKFPTEIDFFNFPIKTDSTWKQFEHFIKCWDAEILDKPHLENVLECFWSLEMKKYTCRLVFPTTIPQSSFNVTSFNMIREMKDSILKVVNDRNIGLENMLFKIEEKIINKIKFQDDCLKELSKSIEENNQCLNALNYNITILKIKFLVFFVFVTVSFFVGFGLHWFMTK